MHFAREEIYFARTRLQKKTVWSAGCPLYVLLPVWPARNKIVHHGNTAVTHAVPAAFVSRLFQVTLTFLCPANGDQPTGSIRGGRIVPPRDLPRLFKPCDRLFEIPRVYRP